MITLGIAHPRREVPEAHDTIRVPDNVKRIVVSALALIIAIDELPRGGEFKRSQVYSRLQKAFPKEQKDDIGFAIEIAVRRMKGKLWL